MNWKPIQYHLGFLKDRPDILSSVAIPLCVYNAVSSFQDANLMTLSLSALLFTTTVKVGSKSFLAQVSLWKNKREVNQFPLELVDKVHIDDAEGLESLLERTAKCEKLEWGTVLTVSEDKKRAVINTILDSHTAEKEHYVFDRETHAIYFNITKANAAGYTGRHHFHPGGQALNYHLNNVDRAAAPGNLHLLTFNLADGPELIGYNTQFTYVPTDKNKRELVKVNYTQLMKYLSNKKMRT